MLFRRQNQAFHVNAVAEPEAFDQVGDDQPRIGVRVPELLQRGDEHPELVRVIPAPDGVKAGRDLHFQLFPELQVEVVPEFAKLILRLFVEQFHERKLELLGQNRVDAAERFFELRRNRANLFGSHPLPAALHDRVHEECRFDVVANLLRTGADDREIIQLIYCEEADFIRIAVDEFPVFRAVQLLRFGHAVRQDHRNDFAAGAGDRVHRCFVVLDAAQGSPVVLDHAPAVVLPGGFVPAQHQVRNRLFRVAAIAARNPDSPELLPGAEAVFPLTLDDCVKFDDGIQRVGQGRSGFSGRGERTVGYQLLQLVRKGAVTAELFRDELRPLTLSVAGDDVIVEVVDFERTAAQLADQRIPGRDQKLDDFKDFRPGCLAFELVHQNAFQNRQLLLDLCPETRRTGVPRPLCIKFGKLLDDRLLRRDLVERARRGEQREHYFTGEIVDRTGPDGVVVHGKNAFSPAVRIFRKQRRNRQTRTLDRRPYLLRPPGVKRLEAGRKARGNQWKSLGRSGGLVHPLRNSQSAVSGYAGPGGRDRQLAGAERGLSTAFLRLFSISSHLDFRLLRRRIGKNRSRFVQFRLACGTHWFILLSIVFHVAAHFVARFHSNHPLTEVRASSTLA